MRHAAGEPPADDGHTRAFFAAAHAGCREQKPFFAQSSRGGFRVVDRELRPSMMKFAVLQAAKDVR